MFRRPQTCREVMDILKYFVHECQDENQIKLLWDVLTALRGPDNNADAIKNATTGLIRTAAFGQHSKIIAVFTSDNETHLATRCQLSLTRTNITLADWREHWHFYSHVRNAFNALGLSWDKINS